MTGEQVDMANAEVANERTKNQLRTSLQSRGFTNVRITDTEDGNYDIQFDQPGIASDLPIAPRTTGLSIPSAIRQTVTSVRNAATRTFAAITPGSQRSRRTQTTQHTLQAPISISNQTQIPSNNRTGAQMSYFPAQPSAAAQEASTSYQHEASTSNPTHQDVAYHPGGSTRTALASGAIASYRRGSGLRNFLRRSSQRNQQSKRKIFRHFFKLLTNKLYVKCKVTMI